MHSNNKKIIDEKSQKHDSPGLMPGDEYKMELVWRNIIIFIVIHIGAVYGFLAEKSWSSIIITLVYGFLGGFGITAGAHRLFAHKAYKAKVPLKVLLIYFQSIAFQNSVYEWSRDHRVHHKYCDTNADPHNARRGFFFSHMGWLLVKKHPDVRNFGRRVEMGDLEADKYIMFQHRHYLPLALFASVFIPFIISYYYCHESFIVSVTFGVLFRYAVSLHITWLINSLAHMWGMKPFDKTISPVENKIVGFLALGEGFHNYHHVFPQDYKTSEFGDYSFNFTTAFLDFFAWLGQAYDLKTVSQEMIAKRAMRTGDGSHNHHHHDHDEKSAIIDENGNILTDTKKSKLVVN